MFLHHFIKKENNDQKIAKKIYLSIITLINLILDNKDLKLRRDFNSSFELMTILMFTIFYSYKGNVKNKSINQQIMDLYIIDLDKSLREIGIGDMSIGKYVKAYIKKFYYRISKLENIFTDNNISEFKMYLADMKIHNDLKNIQILSEFLFNLVNKLLKKAKREDLSVFVFNNLSN